MKILTVLFLSLVAIGCFVWYKFKDFKIQESVEFVYGPFSCTNDHLTINTKYSVNNLAGVTFLTDFTMTYGSTIVFKDINFFRKEYSEKSKTDFKFDEFRKYLDKNFPSSPLPSQEELIARNYRPDERYFINIGTQSPMTTDEREAFLECFKKNKDAIYDNAIKSPPDGPPQAIIFGKVYFLN